MSDDQAAKAFDRLVSDQLMELLSDPTPIAYSDAPFLPRDAASKIEQRVLSWWLREGGGLTKRAIIPESLDEIRAEALKALGDAADQFDVEVVSASDGSVSVSARPKKSFSEQAAIEARTREIADDLNRLAALGEKARRGH